MGDTQAAAKVFQQIRIQVDAHDNGQCESPANGVMMAYADIERLGWEEGDVVYPSKDISLYSGGQYGRIRVMCDGNHSADELESSKDSVDNGIDIQIVKVDAEPLRKKQLQTV